MSAEVVRNEEYYSIQIPNDDLKTWNNADHTMVRLERTFGSGTPQVPESLTVVSKASGTARILAVEQKQMGKSQAEQLIKVLNS